MILSNRKLKLIITCLLLTIFLYFISIFDVKASAFTDLEIHTITGSSQQKTYNGSPSAGNVTIALFDNINIPIGDNHDYLLIPGNFNILFYDVTSSSVTILSPGSDFSIAPLVQFNGQKTVVCELDNNIISCPISDVGLTNLHVTSVSLVVNYIGSSVRSLMARYQIFGNWYVGNLPGKSIAQNTSDINNSINSSDIDTTSSNSEIDSWSNNLPTNNTISNLITMPLTLVRAYLNGFNSSCSSFNLGSLMGTNLILPCINLSQRLGSIWSIIDVLLSGFMIFAIAKRMIKVFNDLTSLKDNQVDSVFGGGN